MSLTQITNYVVIVVLIIVAVCEGVSTAIDYFAAHSKNKLPKEVMTIDQIAKFVVNEAATLDLSGAEKKIQAVQALLDQAKAEGKPITKEVAKGAVQTAYNEQQKAKADAKDDTTEAKPIGFVPSETDDDNGSKK